MADCGFGTKPCGRACIPKNHKCSAGARSSFGVEATRTAALATIGTATTIGLTEASKKGKRWWAKSRKTREVLNKARKTLDAWENRADFQKTLNCGAGSYQCGNRCIPKDNKCGIRTGRKVGRIGLAAEAAGYAAGVAGAASNNRPLMLAGSVLSTAGNMAQLYGSQKIAEGYASQGENTKATLYRALSIGSGAKAALGTATTAARIRNINKYRGEKREIAQL